MTQTTETPSAPSKPGDWRAIFDRFDRAAKSLGWQNDQGSRKSANTAAIEYVAAFAAMLECLASLERERDEAREAGALDMRERAVKFVNNLDAGRAHEMCDHIIQAWIEKPHQFREAFVAALRSYHEALATAISALDPKGDQQ